MEVLRLSKLRVMVCNRHNYLRTSQSPLSSKLKLRENPATAKIPVIFLTAKVQKHELEQYQTLGALGVIRKPFDAMALPDEIRRLVGA